MKAAVLHQLGQSPRYEDFPDPVPTGNQVLVSVKAASVKNLDKGRASGAHYAAHTHLPEVVGVDGVGITADGQRIYGMGLTGMIAEKALVDPKRSTPVPAEMDDVTAAALPNAVLGAALALKYRAGIGPGKNVLVNGATGVTGKVAVQLARHFGAGKVIGTGRNPTALAELRSLGADEVVPLGDSFVSDLKALHASTPIDIVIDYLWGQPLEEVLGALKGGGLHALPHSVRIVTVGSMAGEDIRLPSGFLRSSPIEIVGSGFGSLPAEAMDSLYTDMLPDMFRLAASGGLRMDTEVVPLSDIGDAWTRHIPSGKRLVIVV